MCFLGTFQLQWFIPAAVNAFYFPEGMIIKAVDTHISLKVLGLRFLKEA